MSPWDGYKDKRVDSWTNAGPGRMNTSGRRLDPSPSRDYQYDYNPCSELRHALVGRQFRAYRVIKKLGIKRDIRGA